MGGMRFTREMTVETRPSLPGVTAGPGALLGLQRKWGAMTENTLTSVQVLTTICPFLTLVKIKTALIPASRAGGRMQSTWLMKHLARI